MKEFKEILIEGTLKTPHIEFNNTTGELILQGRSFPENAVSFYEPLADWIGEYVKSPQKTTNLYIKLEYFNSSSLLWIVKMIRLLSKIEKAESSIFFHLYFDNVDIDFNDADELKDVISSLFSNKDELKARIGIKIHGISADGKIVDEPTIFI
jgi:hypothetical protein